MTRFLVPVLAAALILAAPLASAQDKASQKFLTKAIEGNYAEVEMGKLAQRNGGSDAVKSFGKMLEADHGEANQKAMSRKVATHQTAAGGPRTEAFPRMSSNRPRRAPPQ